MIETKAVKPAPSPTARPALTAQATTQPAPKSKGEPAVSRFIEQLGFDYKRLFARNLKYPFFVMLMPIMFYVLYTKIFTFGDAAAVASFHKTYLTSMIVFSVMLGGIMSLSALMQHDRSVGFVRALSMTPTGTRNYYCSLMTLMTLLNMASVIALSLVSMVVNATNLTVLNVLGLMGLLIIGSIPVLALSILYSRISSPQLLSIVSNLTVFPLAIISGLWLPLQMLPAWLQRIGMISPMWATNELMGDWIQGKTLESDAIVNLAAWVAATVAAFAIVALKGQHAGRSQRNNDR
jgi:ABC-2 type transport system permease protein